MPKLDMPSLAPGQPLGQSPGHGHAHGHLHGDHKAAAAAAALRTGDSSVARVPPIVVCGVIPYTTHDEDKATANGAMILEWVHYYASLGFKVIIYDRDGDNERYIFNATHRKLLGIPELKLIYHNYTMRGLLDPQLKIHYDNSEPLNATDSNRKIRYESQGHDKVNTLTHCRFEAKALFNTDLVFVVDFDEFLYCPAAKATAEAQKNYIYGFVQEMQRQGKQQLLFRQRMLFNKTSSPRNCIVKITAAGGSVYNCFAANEFELRGHSVKSLHIGHHCPLTGYHQACPIDDAIRAYNCMCVSEPIPNPKCTLIHLSTQPQLFIKQYTGRNLFRFLSTDNELLSIADYRNNISVEFKQKLYKRYRLNETEESYKLALEKVKQLTKGGAAGAKDREALAESLGLNPADLKLLSDLRSILGGKEGAGTDLLRLVNGGKNPPGAHHDPEHDTWAHKMFVSGLVCLSVSLALLVGFGLGICCTLRFLKSVRLSSRRRPATRRDDGGYVEYLGEMDD